MPGQLSETLSQNFKRWARNVAQWYSIPELDPQYHKKRKRLRTWVGVGGEILELFCRLPIRGLRREKWSPRQNLFGAEQAVAGPGVRQSQGSGLVPEGPLTDLSPQALLLQLCGLETENLTTNCLASYFSSITSLLCSHAQAA